MNDRGLSQELNKYVINPLVILLALLCIDVYLVVTKETFAIVPVVITIIYVLVLLILFLRYREYLVDMIIDMTMHYGQVQKRLIKDLKLPYFLADEEGGILWFNKAANEMFLNEQIKNYDIWDLFPEIDRKSILQLQDRAQSVIRFNDKVYSVDMERMEFDQGRDIEGFSGNLISFCLQDQTEMYGYKQEIEDQKIVTGLIYLDNYDETLGNMDDVKNSLLSALLERKIRKYFNAEDGIVRKMDKDKFMVILKAKDFKKLESERFTILSDIKNVNIGDDIIVTISMGFGIDGESYAQSMDFAGMAIELALGRGGDQAVIKSPKEQAYYGGSTSQMNRNTRVKARVKAQAFRELVQNAENVFIMGHKLADVDAFGASVGIASAVRTFDKKVYIVLDEVTASVKTFKDLYSKESDLFKTGKEALALINSDSVVVVVDANKPSMCECSELLDKTRNIVVFDHHRQGTEVIRNAILAYIEPHASSTCEMITEMIPYFDDKMKLRREDADCMYAGMVIDTNNFNTKTGVRTFEAAAYLRRNGADVTRVRRMLREDMESYKLKAQVAINTEVFNDEFAIGLCIGGNLESPTVVGAQAANELLNIIGIRASFVLTPFKDLIYISARSEDLNVQLIMEKLGGGGHLNTAGAQLANCTLEDAKLILKEAITQSMKERME